MKTLDEVIKAYEICHASVLSCEGCPYDNGERYRDSDCYISDALHYLKEYQAILPLVPSLINTTIAVQKKGKTIG